MNEVLRGDTCTSRRFLKSFVSDDNYYKKKNYLDKERDKFEMREEENNELKSGIDYVRKSL